MTVRELIKELVSVGNLDMDVVVRTEQGFKRVSKAYGKVLGSHKHPEAVIYLELGEDVFYDLAVGLTKPGGDVKATRKAMRGLR